MYTKKIKDAVDKLMSPDNFIVDIVGYEEFDPQFIGLRFYSSQWYAFNDEERLTAALYLKEMKETIESFNILVTLEPVEGAPQDI